MMTVDFLDLLLPVITTSNNYFHYWLAVDYFPVYLINHSVYKLLTSNINVINNLRQPRVMSTISLFQWANKKAETQHN